MQVLTNKEEMVIRYRYGLTEDRIARTLEETAELLNISREMVRQLELKAIKKLKHPSLRKLWDEVIETKREIYG